MALPTEDQLRFGYVTGGAAFPQRPPYEYNVDGERITARELVTGELIRVGNCTIEYLVDDELQASLGKAARSAGISIGSKRVQPAPRKPSLSKPVLT